jgi:hypothetical protein
MLQGRRSARPPDVVGVLDLQKARVSCHYMPLPKSEDMMGKPKPQDSARLLLVEVLYRGKFFKNKEYRKKSAMGLKCL